MTASPRSSPSICLFTRMWRRNGTGLFAQELAGGLVASGASVTFVCPMTTSPAFEQPRPGLKRIRPPRERDDGPRIQRMLASLARIGVGALALFRARLRNRHFILSIPDPLVFAAMEMVLLRLTGTRVIYVAHDILPHAWKFSSRLRAFERATYAACYGAASAVVVLSEPTRAALHAAFPGIVTPVHVIDHGPLEVGAPSPVPGSRHLLCFGTLRRNKGVIEAMRGVAAARTAGIDVTLVVAGDTHAEEPGYADECEAVAVQLGSCIDLRRGYVDDDAVAGLLAECDALVMPYGEFHSQSGVALLAAANARPIIASAAGGLQPLLDEGFPAARIADPTDPASVAAAVAEFYAVPAETWAARATDYRRFVLEERSWLRCAEAYLAVAA